MCVCVLRVHAMQGGAIGARDRNVFYFLPAEECSRFACAVARSTSCEMKRKSLTQTIPRLFSRCVRVHADACEFAFRA